MASIEIERAFSLDIPGRPLPYVDLAHIALINADKVGVGDEIRRPTMELFEEYHNFHPSSAAGCVEVMELGLAFAGTVEEIVPEAPVNKPAAWASGLTHDVGKIDRGIQLILDSDAGIWSENRTRRMMRHPEDSRRRALEAGLPEDVANPDGAHHEVQLFGGYGARRKLTDGQVITARGTGFGDFTDAMAGRDNSRNARLGEGERLDMIGRNLSLLLDHEVFQGKGSQIHEAIMDETVVPFVRRKFVIVQQQRQAASLN